MGKVPSLACTHPQWGKRKCLKCDRMFPSLGPQNRICADCESNNSQLTRAEKLGESLRQYMQYLRRRKKCDF